MSQTVQLYWWPRCGTCRTARAELAQSGVPFEERDFFKQPFTREELLSLLGGQSPRTLFNFKSQAFKKSGLDPDSLSDDDLLRLLSEEPRYFKRPMVVINGKLLAGVGAKQIQAELGR